MVTKLKNLNFDETKTQIVITLNSDCDKTQKLKL